ncbi:unnamed protein product [Cyprideis torosa]|uniref:Insulin gene enhancer protein ISL-1 n=1 Tax=Cyprideis torosa TaxID=163714 RepID=A0A7R8W085_9CRUS|nr:unnamed protein product [Cyprideis torosa]CAG0879475.1 unnamed protein product [Cyprideis torosa]
MSDHPAILAQCDVLKRSNHFRYQRAKQRRRKSDPDDPERRRSSLCVGCGAEIYDQFILRVAPDLEWHAACLKCADCHQYLDESCTCFVRDGKTYCKRDYVKLFGAKCSKCGGNFGKSDFVMRARNKIYHTECFRCVACERQLIPGDEFALREEGLFCKADSEVSSDGFGNPASCFSANMNNNNPSISTSNNSPSSNHSGGQSSGKNLHSFAKRIQSQPTLKGLIRKYTLQRNESKELHLLRSADRVSVSDEGSSHEKKSDKSDKKKTTRVRTVLNEKQLHTLRTCYNANPRPDALMKEQLVEMTQLSPRVIRVWFQNKRCKDKKRSIALKQMQEQEKTGSRMALQGMQGVPMIASSPIRHEPNADSSVTPTEVTSYQPPWKALSDFALQGDLDRMDPGTPHFQHLVHQMHGYGPGSNHTDAPSDPLHIPGQTMLPDSSHLPPHHEGPLPPHPGESPMLRNLSGYSSLTNHLDVASDAVVMLPGTPELSSPCSE